MMEIQIQQGKVYTTEPGGNTITEVRRVAMCGQHMGDTLADYLMDPEALVDLERHRAEHNAERHPRRWRRHQRRLEVLDELQAHLKDDRAIEMTARTENRDWAAALPFKVPPLERARLKEEGLLPGAPEEYRREFPAVEEKETL